MYSYKIFNNAEELVDFLNGAVIGKQLPGTVFGLHSRTFIVNDGVGDRTCTFADASGLGLTPAQIIKQIGDAHANLKASVQLRSYGTGDRMLIINKAGYILRGAGTANAVLGFGSVDVTVTEVATANIIHTSSSHEGARFQLVIHTA